MMREAVIGPQFICDFSGFKFPLSEAVRNWDGAVVHYSYRDKRNPADLIRTIPERRTLPYSRPEAGDTFISGTVMPGGEIASDSLLLEDGGHLLLEDGGRLLL